MKIYLDFRTDGFVKEIDPITPPESFFTYELGEDPRIVIEKYKLENGYRIDYAYSLFERNQMTGQVESLKRDRFFKEHLGENYVFPELLSIVIPKSVFLSYCEEAGFDDYINAIKIGKWD